MTWIAVLLASAATYLLRASGLVFTAGRRLPRAIEARVWLVAPAALGALVSASAMRNQHSLAVAVASVAAFVAARRTRHPYAALLVGFPTLWCAQLLLG